MNKVKRPQMVAPAQRLLIAAEAAPAAPLLDTVCRYLRLNGHPGAAALLREQFPNAPEHVVLFDAAYGSAGGPIAGGPIAGALDTHRLPEAAIVAIFGPTRTRGDEVEEQAYRDAHRFIQAEKLAAHAADIRAGLVHVRQMSAPALAALDAFLDAVAPRQQDQMGPRVPRDPKGPEVQNG